MTTNCGGVSPALSFSIFGCFGWGPESRQDPSLPGAAAGVVEVGDPGVVVPGALEPEEPDVPVAPDPVEGERFSTSWSHAARAAAALTPSPPVNRRRRLRSDT